MFSNLYNIARSDSISFKTKNPITLKLPCKLNQGIIIVIIEQHFTITKIMKTAGQDI